MKSLKYLIVFSVLLAVIAILLVLKSHKGTIPGAIKSVSVPNIDEISQINISSGVDQIKLVKENGTWSLNDVFKVKKTAIDLVLNMLQRLEIAAPVQRDRQALIAKKLENTGRHVQIYSGNHLLRSFFIGYDTSESRSTVYMKEGSKKPYFLKLKGYSLSDISLLFSPRVRFWRDNILFNCKPAEISVIQVEYPGNQSQSFTIRINPDNKPELIKTITGEKMKNSDVNEVFHYLYYFSGISYHLPDTDSLPSMNDSLPFAEIGITDISGTQVQVKLYRKALKINSGETQQFDLYWCYGQINNEEEIVSIKYMDIDPILKELDDFLKK